MRRSDTLRRLIQLMSEARTLVEALKESEADSIRARPAPLKKRRRVFRLGSKRLHLKVIEGGKKSDEGGDVF